MSLVAVLYLKNSNYKTKFYFERHQSITLRFFKMFLCLVAVQRNLIFLIFLNFPFSIAWISPVVFLLEWFSFWKFKNMLWICNLVFSFLNSPCVQGPVFFLEDGKSAISLNDALMWAKVNPFSPLGTGIRLNPFWQNVLLRASSFFKDLSWLALL